MTTIIAIIYRTVLIYVILMIAIRLMGKRQIGELDMSDFITTLLISEIASLPITEKDIPLMHAILPIFIITIFELLSSFLVANYPRVKNILTTRPQMLIRNGELCVKELRKARISTDELISELRQSGVCGINEVEYAILEQNGKISVLPKAAHRPPTVKELKLSVNDTGIYHIVIEQGVINQHGLNTVNMKKTDIEDKLKKMNLEIKDIYLMMVNDSGEVEIVRRK